MGCSASTDTNSADAPTLGDAVENMTDKVEETAASADKKIAARKSSVDRQAARAQAKVKKEAEKAEKAAAKAKADAEKAAAKAAADAEKAAAKVAADAENAAAAAEKKAQDAIGHDDHPDLEDTGKYAAVEKEIHSALMDKEQLKEMWGRLDFNGNNKVSLAEIDKWVIEKYPVLDSKPALMRAYKRTTVKEGDGDAWVEKMEFRSLLRNLLYFNKVFDAFDGVDKDDDRRVNFEEMYAGLDKLGMKMSKEDAQKEFDSMDANDGGQVLFDEFASWYSGKMCPGNEEIDLID